MLIILFDTTFFFSRINKILSGKNFLKNDSEGHQQNLLGSIFVQLGLVDILKELEVYPAAVYGDSWGKLATGYYYGALTLEECLKTATNLTQNSLEFEPELLNNKLRSDSLTHDNLTKLVLNVSDSSLNNRDVLVTDGEKIKLLQTIGR